MDINSVVLRVVVDGVGNANAQINSLIAGGNNASRAISGLGLALAAAAIGTAKLAQEFISVADSMTLLSARLKLATTSAKEYADAQKFTFEIAQRTASGIKEITGLYTKLADPIRRAGGASRETSAIVEAFTKTLKISGASAQETASAITQFGQAMGSGKLQGDEFKSLTENAPRLLKAIAEGSKTPIEQLKKFASEGKLTADVIGNALMKSLSGLNREFEQLPKTSEAAFELVKNDTLKMVDDLNKEFNFTSIGTGFFDSIRSGIPELKKELQGLFQTFKDFFKENAQEIDKIIMNFRGVSSEIYNGVKGMALLGATAGEVATEGGLINTTLETMRFLVAGVKDGFRLILASIVDVGATLIEVISIPLSNIVESQGKLAEFQGKLFRSDTLKEFGKDIQNVATGIRNTTKDARTFVSEIDESFASGNTEFAKVGKSIEENNKRSAQNLVVNELLKKSYSDMGREGRSWLQAQSSGLKDLKSDVSDADKDAKKIQSAYQQLFESLTVGAKKASQEIETLYANKDPRTSSRETEVRARLESDKMLIKINKDKKDSLIELAQFEDKQLQRVNLLTEAFNARKAAELNQAQSIDLIKKGAIAASEYEEALRKVALGHVEFQIKTDKSIYLESKMSEAIAKNDNDLAKNVINTRTATAQIAALTIEYQKNAAGANYTAEATAVLAVKNVMASDSYKSLAVEAARARDSIAAISDAVRIGIDLQSQTEQIGVDLISNEQERAKAQLARDVKLKQSQIDIAKSKYSELAKLDDQRLQEVSGMSRKELDAQSQALTTSQEQLNKYIEASRTKITIDSWKPFVDKTKSYFSDGMKAMLSKEEGAWKSFTQRLADEWQNTLIDQIYKSFVEPLVLNLVVNQSQQGKSGSSGSGFDLQGLFNAGKSLFGGGKTADMSGSGMTGGLDAQDYGTTSSGSGFSSLFGSGGSWSGGTSGQMGSAGPWAAIAGVVGSAAAKDKSKSSSAGAGAAAGAQVGSYFGPWGTAIGAVVGFIAGGGLEDGLAERKGKFRTASSAGGIGQYQRAAGTRTSALGVTGIVDDKWFSDEEMGPALKGLMDSLQTMDDALVAGLKLRGSELDKAKSAVAGTTREYDFGTEHENLASTLVNVFKDRYSAILDQQGAAWGDFVRSFDGETKDFPATLEKIVTAADRFKQANVIFGQAVELTDFTKFETNGEKLYETFNRLADVYKVTDDVVSIFGKGFADSIKSMGLATADARLQLVDFAGGAQALSEGLASYIKDFIDPAEQARNAISGLADEITAAGVAIPGSASEFRKLVQGIDLTTEAGRKQFAQLISIEPKIKAYTDAIAMQAKIFTGLDASTTGKSLIDAVFNAENAAQAGKNAVNAIADSIVQSITGVIGDTIGRMVFDSIITPLSNAIASQAGSVITGGATAGAAMATGGKIGGEELAKAVGAVKNYLDALKTVLSDEGIKGAIKGILPAINDVGQSLFGVIDPFRSGIGSAKVAVDSFNQSAQDAEERAKAIADANKSLADFIAGINKQIGRWGMSELERKIADANDLYKDQTERLNEFSKAGATVSDQMRKTVDTLRDLTIAQAKFDDGLSNLRKTLEDISSVGGLIKMIDDSIRSIMVDTKQLTTVDAINSQINDSKNRLAELDALSASPGERVQEAQNLLSLINQRYQAEKEGIDNVTESIKKSTDFAKGLKDFLASLNTSDLSPKSLEERMKESQNQFRSTLQAAKAGDVNAQGRLQGVINTALGLTRDYYASSEGYAKFFDEVQATSTATIEQITTDAQKQTNELKVLTSLGAKTIAELQAYRNQASSYQSFLQSDAARQYEELKKQSDLLGGSGPIAKAIDSLGADLRGALGIAVAPKPITGTITQTGTAPSMPTGVSGFKSLSSALASSQDYLGLYNLAKSMGITLSEVDGALGLSPGAAANWARANGMPIFAGGGIVRRPTAAVIGDRPDGNPEAVVRMENGAIPVSLGSSISVSMQMMAKKIEELTATIKAQQEQILRLEQAKIARNEEIEQIKIAKTDEMAKDLARIRKELA